MRLKSFIILLLAGLLIPWMAVFAQNEWETTKNQPKIINDIDVFFCNEGFEADQLQENVNTALKQLEEKKICIAINNKGQRDAHVKISFHNWILDSLGAKSCTAKSNDNFSKFIKKDFETVAVPANWYTVKYFTIKAPIGIQWIQNGCLAYSATEDTKNSEMPNSMVSMVVRKIRLIDFFVWDMADIENKIEIIDIKKNIDENGNLKISFFIKNVWNIDSFTEVEWVVSNMFWFNQKLSLSGYEINSTQTVEVVGNLWQLPSYKGPFNIDLNFKTTPKFDFDISEFEIDEEITKGITTTISTSIFLMPWMVVWIAVLIILLLFLAFRKPKQKVVYVEKPTTK